MKALKLRIDEGLYKEFKEIHPAYGEESRVFRALLEAYVRKARRRDLKRSEREVIEDVTAKV